MCEIMAGAVAGGQRTDEPRKGGVAEQHVRGADRCLAAGESRRDFLAGIEATKAHIRSARAAPVREEILLPGEPERRGSGSARHGDSD